MNGTEEDFSQSLTPPVSPFAAASPCDLTPALPPCFTCVSKPGREQDPRAVSEDAYIGRGCLKRLLLRLDPAPADYEADTVDLFGFLWVTETALVESTKLLFALLRQKVMKLETLVQASSHDFGQASVLHYEAEDLRHQCVMFLQYVKVFLHRYLCPPRPEEASPHPFEALEAAFPSALLEELFGLSLLIGRLRDLPANLQAAFSIQHQGKLFPPSWHLLHVHLDIHWSLLELLHLLGHKMQGQVVYVQQDLTGENVTDVSLLEQLLTDLLCDLTSLALSKYSKVRPTEALTSQPYLCSCTKELWILLIHLLEHRSKVLHTQSFWSYMNTALLRPLLGGGVSTLLGGGASAEQSSLPTCKDPLVSMPTCKDPLGFSWWLVTHLAQLGQVSSSGSLQTEKQLEDNWSFVGELLRSSFNPKGVLQEEQVRMHVHCCLSVCLLWGPSTSTVSTLWEYYSRHLGSSFSVPWLGVSGLASVSRTPLALLEQARGCCDPAPLGSAGHAQLYRHASSFLVFLRVLALYLGQEQGGAPWRQIKGRMYSKFHQRRMCELSEAGLANFLLLFLVVALRADPEDVAGRVCDLLGLLPSHTGPPAPSAPPASPAPALRGLVWRGQLALLLLLQERGLDVGPQACWLAASFAQSAREFYLRTTEPARRLALWGPLASYLEGVAEVFETSRGLELSEERLLNEGFGLLLPACRTTELGSALGFLQNVLAQLRRVHQRCVQAGPSVASACRERHLAVAAALWTHFFPFLRSLRLSQTPPAQLADAAAGFTLLAFDLPGSAPQDLQPSPVQSIMHCFGWDDMLHPLLVTRYLPHLLHDSELLASVSSGGAGAGSGAGSGPGPGPGSGPGSGPGPAQALCVRAWFRCFLQQHLHKNADGSHSRTGQAVDDQLCELTRQVLRLSEVDSLLQRAGLQTTAASHTLTHTTAPRPEPRHTLQVFIKAVSRVYAGLQDLSERAAMVTKALEYIGDVLKHIKPYLVNKSQEGLTLAYWAVGTVVKHWSPLLATSKAQQLLFRLVEVLLLPHTLTHLEQPIRDSLPLYLQGLSVAAGTSQSQGAGLKQQLRSVIAKYLDHFLPATPSAGAIANHPVLLAACEATPTPRGAALRRSILQVLCDSFLLFKGPAPPPRLAAVLALLLELLRRNRDADHALLATPLPSALRCLMLVNEPQVRRIGTEVVQLLMERCSAAAASSDAPCDQTVAALRSLVEENEGVYDRQVFCVLETVAVLQPSAVQVLLPVLSLSLRNTEHKRGLGRNTTLRNAYRKLLSLLGDVGQAEIISLEEE